MKFGALFESQMVSKWCEFYVDYNELKQQLELFETPFNSGLISRDDSMISLSHDEDCDDNESIPTQRRKSFIFGDSDDEKEQAIMRNRFINNNTHYAQLPDEKKRHSRTLGLHASLLSSSSKHSEKCMNFVDTLKSEIIKADAFYSDLVERLNRTLTALLSHANEVLNENAVRMSSQQLANKMNHLKSQFVDLYRESNQLLNFCLLNFQACKKISKKFRKTSMTHSTSELSKLVAITKFSQHTELPHLMKTTISEFSRHFHNNDTTAAKISLLSRLTEFEFSRRDVFRLGLKTGISLALIVWLISYFCQHCNEFSPDKKLEFVAFRPVYRACVAVILLIWLWACLLYVWRRVRVNFVYIFEFEPSCRLTFFQVFDEASNLTAIVFSSFLLFLYTLFSPSDSFLHIIPSSVYPRSLLIFMLAKLLAPPALGSLWPARRVLLSSTYNAFIAPFGRLRFTEFFIADVFTSLVKVLSDIAASMCVCIVWPNLSGISRCHSASRYYTPVLSVAPLLARFLQCLKRYWMSGDRWPNLANAGKYALAHAVVLCSVLHPSLLQVDPQKDNTTHLLFRFVFICAFLSSTIFVSIWDIFIDWALKIPIPCASVEALSRRQRVLLYNRLYIYICAAIINVLLRFFWTLSLIPFETNPFFTNPVGDDLYQNALLPLLTMIEIFRRMLWAMFRVEAEHTGHADDFRAHNVPVPLYFDNMRELEARKKQQRKQSSFGLASELALMFVVLVGLSALGAIAGGN